MIKKMVFLIFIMIIAASAIYSESVTNNQYTVTTDDIIKKLSNFQDIHYELEEKESLKEFISTEGQISGIEIMTEFIMDRANINHIYTINKLLTGNEWFELHFPISQNYISQSDFQQFISLGDMAQEIILLEMQNYLEKAMYNANRLVLEKLISQLETKNLDETILSELYKVISNIDENEIFQISKTQYNRIIDTLMGVKQTNTQVTKFITDLENYFKMVYEMSRLENLGAKINYLKYTIENNYTNEVNQSQVFELTNQSISSDLDEFFNIVYLFAEIAQADSKEDILILLENFTLPPVSFQLKRNVNRPSVFLNSYAGLRVMYKNNATGYDKTNFNYDLFAPIGIEAVFPCGRNSFSLMVTIIDLKDPFEELLFNGSIDSQYDLKNMIKPGIYAIFGIAKVPVSIGAGIWFDNIEFGTTEGSIFIGYDLPLYRFKTKL